MLSKLFLQSRLKTLHVMSKLLIFRADSFKSTFRFLFFPSPSLLFIVVGLVADCCRATDGVHLLTPLHLSRGRLIYLPLPGPAHVPTHCFLFQQSLLSPPPLLLLIEEKWREVSLTPSAQCSDGSALSVSVMTVFFLSLKVIS